MWYAKTECNNKEGYKRSIETVFRCSLTRNADYIDEHGSPMKSGQIVI
jgi:hypothetical protein